MIHYHGTPISPITALMKLKGRHFCVSHAASQDIERVHQIGQSVMLDNGAFSKWKAAARATRSGQSDNNNEPAQVDWLPYYAWCERWLACPTTWAVIPDVIDGGSQLQDALLKEWPFKHRGAPVWHMDEPLDRLLRLADEWPKVCIGSTAEYARVLSPAWRLRMDECWNAISVRHSFLPWIHMLRGMQLSGMEWPFASVDSTDIGRNHNRTRDKPAPLFYDDGGETHPLKMAERWDCLQTPMKWHQRSNQTEEQTWHIQPTMPSDLLTIDALPARVKRRTR